MDTSIVYEYNFSRLLEMIRRSSVAIFEVRNEFYLDKRPIFNFISEQQDAFHSILSTNEYRAQNTIETIVLKLCDMYDVDYTIHPSYPPMKTNRKDFLDHYRPIRLVVNNNSKRIGYFFYGNLNEVIKNKINNQLEVDELIIVSYYDPEPSSISAKIIINKNELEEYKDNGIRLVTLRTVFVDLFGKEEFEQFYKYLCEFNEQARYALGYNTVVSPTEHAIDSFKKKTVDMLSSFNYKELLSDDLYNKQIEIINDNYIGKKLYRLLTGNSLFADSFISSEWMMSVYQLSENIDMTGVVAGYLKSIEQLLLAIAKLNIDTGKKIRLRTQEYSDFSTENENQIDTSLGSITVFFKNNGDLLDVNHYAKNYITKIIDDWREKQRNGYFHEDNLHDIDKVYEIREKALLLYYLILGGFSIKPEQFEKLGMVKTPEKATIDIVLRDTYLSFVEWLEPLLLYGFPKETVSIELWVDPDTKDNSFSKDLELSTCWSVNLNAYDRLIYNDEDRSAGRVFETHNYEYKSKYSMTDTEFKKVFKTVLKRYLDKGDHKNLLLQYQELKIVLFPTNRFRDVEEMRLL